MVNLGLLAITHRLLVGGGWDGRVRLDLDAENWRVEGLGRPEGADDD